MRYLHSRNALLVGIVDYKHVENFEALESPRLDVRSLSAELKEHFKFKSPRSKIGAYSSDHLDNEIISKFFNQSRKAGVLLIYVSAHGLRKGFNTYIVGHNAFLTPGDSDKVLNRSLSCSQIVKDARRCAPKARKVFIFDCCRNQAQTVFDQRIDDSEPLQPIHNEIIVFSTNLQSKALGSIVSEDKQPEQNQKPGLYVTKLIEQLKARDARLSEVLRKTQVEVEKASNGLQKPENLIHSSMERFVLSPDSSTFMSRHPKYGACTIPAKGNICSIDVSSSGQSIAVTSGGDSTDPRLTLYRDRNLRDPIKVLELESKVYCVRFSPDSRKVGLGCRNGVLQILSGFRPGEESGIAIESSTKLSNSPINSIDWNSNGTAVAAATSCGRIKVLQTELLEPLANMELAEPNNHLSSWCTSWHPTAPILVAGSSDHLCRFWRSDKFDFGRLTPAYAMARKPIGLNSAVRSIRFSNSGELLAVGTQSGGITIYDFDASNLNVKVRCRFTHKLPDKTVQCKRKRLISKIIESSNKGLENKKKTITQNNLFILTLDFSPDGKVLFYGTNIDGYHAYSVERDRPIATSWDLVDEPKRNWWHRASEVRVCPERSALYVGCGVRLHHLNY